MFGFILFLLFLFFIFIPLCKIAWRAYSIHRQWRDATQGLRDTFAQAGQRRSNAAQGQQKAAKKKKIDPNVGEYVAFEDIACTVGSSPSDQTSASFRAESQVEDAVWEDID